MWIMGGGRRESREKTGKKEKVAPVWGIAFPPMNFASLHVVNKLWHISQIGDMKQVPEPCPNTTEVL